MTDGPVLVLGAGGLLGRAMLEACAEAGREAVGLPRAACDIAAPGAVARALAESGATFCVNAAAATDVDRCEGDPAWGWRVNALGPRLVARACRGAGARCVHVSTDYVFDGDKGAPYDESDAPTPLSAYARSKLEGERAVLSEQPEALVLRTAWLFGPGGHNFVSQMPRLLRERGRVDAVCDQWSSPTAAADLAAWIVANAGRAAGGVYHTVNGGALSYADVARVIADALGLDPATCVGEVSAATLTRAARRPRTTALISAALPAEGLPQLRPAREALRELAHAP
jgi:dTDP-4-dehydrorhamnose reductase